MARRSRRAVRPIFTVCLVIAAVFAAGAVPALVRTNTGHLFEGGLSGLAPTIRLADPASVVGPAAQYDIPISSILQIFVDFPRLVVETEDYVYVAPYSAFTGIGQVLRIDQRGDGTDIPTATVQAIALNGQAFRPLPREWLGQGFLVLEKSRSPQKEAAPTAETPARSLETAPSGEDDLVWGELNPTSPPEATSEGLPWWVGLIAVGVIVALLLFSSSQTPA